MGQVLVITKYMVKERVVNPILRRRYLAIAYFIVLAGIILSIASVLLANNNSVQGEQDRLGIARELRAYILSIGLDKNNIIDIGSLAMLLVIICGLLRGKHKIIVDEAEYELVLSQPISIPVYITSRILYNTMRTLMPMPILFTFIPLYMDLNNGNITKAFLAPLSITLMLFVFEVSMNTVTLVNNLLNKLGYRKYMYIGLTTYLAVGLIHSLETKHISPLFTTPLRSLMELLVYPLTLSETLADVLVSLYKTLVILALAFTLTLLLSRHVDPEDMTPLEEVIASKHVEVLRKTHRPLVVSKSPSSTIRLFILKRSIMSPTHIRNLLIALTATATISLVVRTLIPVNLLPLTLFTTSILPAMIIAAGFASTIQFTLAKDIQAYWIYRVYLIEMKSVAESLLAKYVVYLTELLLITAIANTILTNNTLYLLYPLTTLPSAIITGFLILATISYFISKKKTIKHLPTGIDILEELVSGIIWTIVVISTTTTLIIFNILITHPPTTIITSTTTLILTPPLYTLLAKTLSKIMQTHDITT